MITPDLITKNDVENIKDYIHESNREEGYDEFVVSGVDLDTLVKLRNETLAKNPNERPENIDIVLGDKRAGLWITWCTLKDKVIKTETLPGNTDYQFCAGPLANLLAYKFVVNKLMATRARKNRFIRKFLFMTKL